MTKRRFRAPGYSVSTRGHSVLHRGTYGFTPRRFGSDTFAPEFVPRRFYDSSAEEYALDSAVSHATSYSDSSLYDTYDTASRSRGRDQQLLNDATAAIVSSEPHTASARASAAVWRVARKPVPPPAKPLYPYRKEVASYPTSWSPAYYTPRSKTVIYVGANSPWAGVYVLPYASRERAPQYFDKREPRPARWSEEMMPYPYWYRGRSVISSPAKYYSRPKRAQAPPRYRLRYLQSGYATYRIPRRAKAAIVASTVEVEPRRKRPRSKFAADKLRSSSRGKSESSVQPVYTAGLHASRPPLPLPSDRRAIRDVEGFTKPRNLLSWQYRLESRMDPTDIIYKPGSFVRMRESVRDAQDKMDRHRQLLDRYLTDSGPAYDVQGSVQRKMEELERRDPGSRKKKY